MLDPNQPPSLHFASVFRGAGRITIKNKSNAKCDIELVQEPDLLVVVSALTTLFMSGVSLHLI